jgi:hypothetical protein
MGGGGVKGTAISSVVEDVNRLLAEGRIARHNLEVQLEPEDFAILAEKVFPSNWYPLGTYGRLTRVLLDAEGEGSLEYLVERGRRSAERLRQAGLYAAQLKVDRDHWGERVGQMMVPLGPAIYRDTFWRIDLTDADGEVSFAIEVDVPAEFPDLCRHQTQGFIEHAATYAAEAPVEVTSERVTATRLRFRGRHGRPGNGRDRGAESLNRAARSDDARPVSSGVPNDDGRYERFALILAPGQSRLGTEALGLVERGIDPLYASDVDEAHLLALQESGRVGALVLPGDLALPVLDTLIDRIGPHLWAGPAAIVVVGPPDDRDLLRALRDRSLSWVLRDPYDAAEFRFVVSAALSSEDKLEARTGLRVPIAQPVRVTSASREQQGSIRNLSIGGAYIALEAPPAPGERILLACQLGEFRFSPEAVVVYNQTPGTTGRAVRESGMGVAFRSLDDAARAALTIFVEERVRCFQL